MTFGHLSGQGFGGITPGQGGYSGVQPGQGAYSGAHPGQGAFSGPAQFWAPMSTVPSQALPNAYQHQSFGTTPTVFDSPGGTVEMAAPDAGGVLDIPVATQHASGTVPIAIEGGSEGVIQDAQGAQDASADAAWWNMHGDLRFPRQLHERYVEPTFERVQPYVEEGAGWLTRRTGILGMQTPNWLIAAAVVGGGCLLLRKGKR